MSSLYSVPAKFGFLAGDADSGASATASGFFRLIKWLISVALGFSTTGAGALDEDPPADDDDPLPFEVGSGFGFISFAISRLTSSTD